MALSDFLSAFGQSFNDQYGADPMNPEGGDLYSGGMGTMQQAQYGMDRAAPAQMPTQPVQPAQPPKRSGLKSFLGQLGDVILAGSGAEPIYGPKMERKRLGEAMAGYLGQSDAQLAELMRTDPDTAFQVLKFKQSMQPKPVEPTALQQNLDYLRRLNPTMTDAQLAEVAQYAIAAPRMYGSPEMGWQPDPNYPFARGGQAQQSQAPQQRAPQSGPAPGAIEDGYQFMGGDPSSPSSWKKVSGGGVSNGTGGFRP